MRDVCVQVDWVEAVCLATQQLLRRGLLYCSMVDNLSSFSRACQDLLARAVRYRLC